MIEFNLDNDKEITYSKKTGKFTIPVIAENGNKINLEMTQEDMNKFLETSKLILTDDCKGVKH